MEKKFFAIILAALVFAPFATADIIEPGYRQVGIDNSITNISDFPDYTFISVGLSGPGLNMCQVKVVGADGQISPYYKFCSISVYAIKTNNFDLGKAQGFSEAADLEAYLSSVSAKKVLSGLEASGGQVPISDPTPSVIQKEYTVDLEKTIDAGAGQPMPIDAIPPDYSLYLYIGIPLIALLAIAFLIVKRRKK